MGREMAVGPDQREHAPRAALELAGEALEALAEAGAGVAAASSLAEALQRVADGAARAAGADVAVVRVADDERRSLIVSAVSSVSSAVAAELDGTRIPIDELDSGDVDELGRLAGAVARVARRLGATASLQVPVRGATEVVGRIELLRSGVSFANTERRAAHLSAAQAALALRAFGAGAAARYDPAAPLSLAGDALAASWDEDETAEHVARVAVEGTRAMAGLLWQEGDAGGPLVLAGSYGLDPAEASLAEAAETAARGLSGHGPVTVETCGGLPLEAAVSATLQLGQPPIGALQLLFAPDDAPSGAQLPRLATFGVRAAHALRTSMQGRAMTVELDRTRALLAVVSQAISQLSVAHTLETAIRRVAELLDVDRLAVYLREDERLSAAAGIGLAGPHVPLAERLLELALGSDGGRGLVAVADVVADSRFASTVDAATETGIEGAIGVPLVVRDETIGLFAVFPERGRMLTENESALLNALAAQLAVAVQNAQLHEQTKLLGEQRERALDSERESARRLRALYEISRSFAQSLSLEATLAAVARTVTEVLDADLALIGMPDERREWLVPRALHVGEPRLEEVGRALVWRPVPFGAHLIQRLFRLGEPFELTSESIDQVGEPATALLPFLERGWSGAVVPVATPAEVLASITVLSFRAENAIGQQAIDTAQAIAGQAALAIDNARLYQQQKGFADTMQRSLLPRSLPTLRGLELGDAYQSSARVEVGGDVYDFLEIEDGRLAVVLGDVTGHGIEAAADMAMAKFVFRSLAREHPGPADFLQAANDIVVGEIAPGKFITMVYLLVDPESGEVAAAGAGHPPPRVVDSDGVVTSIDVRGLVLGIEAGQTYEEIRAPLSPGGSVVLYTDGVLEARHEGELYGFERLDAIVSEGRDLSARDLAETVLADCRDFANNELADDCAVVVIRRP